MSYFNKISKKNICFIGLMGSGKSRIGKEIAKIYKIEFFDSDKYIEKKYGNSIEFYFENYGEEYFRSIEEEVCTKLLKKENCVISLGGGSILSSNVRQLVKKNSLSIYLKVDINILAERLKYSKNRPLLKNVDKTAKLKELFNKRDKFYSKADIILFNNQSINVILDEINLKLF